MGLTRLEHLETSCGVAILDDFVFDLYEQLLHHLQVSHRKHGDPQPQVQNP